VGATERKIVNMSGASELREPSSPYNGDFMPENVGLSDENMHYWDIYHDNSVR
jgi:hypothetical protein